MHAFRKLALNLALAAIPAMIVGFGLTLAAPHAQAQISISIGAEPVCPYGYFDYAPYPCAPEGYYGPEWFNGGIFIGAGPWFHGPANFQGHVNNHFSPQHGYKGHIPQRNEAARGAKPGNPPKFKSNETRDGRGHVVKGGKGPGH